ncbi:MAG: ROK family protein [Clostridiales bacterium]|nr:ROK family protein [Clostridiales bacterium]
MYYIGIDLGGTDIKAGIINKNGEVLSKAQTATLANRPYQEVAKDMAMCSLKALEKSSLTLDDIGGIGIGIPGLADNVSGRVIFCTNLGWNDIPLRDEVQKYLNLPILIDNDATVAGFAESISGVSRGLHSSVFLTLGTGVGGGIVIDGKPWTGAHGVASEIGHLTIEIDGIPCTCGKSGCLERYCSATALKHISGEICKFHPECSLMKMAKGDSNNITGRMVMDLAKNGDEFALKIFHRYTKNLAIAINTIISFLDPDMIVLGGGISHAGQFLVDAILEKLPDYLMFKTLPYSRIALATLGNDAGIIGAAMLSKLGLDYN